jgi:hypothetical protein
MTATAAPRSATVWPAPQKVPRRQERTTLRCWLYEIHDIHRFPRVQAFVSYCRLVKSSRTSASLRWSPRCGGKRRPARAFNVTRLEAAPNQHASPVEGRSDAAPG